MSILKSITDNLALMAISKVDKQIDGKEQGILLDKILDEKLGGKLSEGLQRGIITNYLHELLTGLYNEDPMKLSDFYATKAIEIRIEQKI